MSNYGYELKISGRSAHIEIGPWDELNPSHRFRDLFEVYSQIKHLDRQLVLITAFNSKYSNMAGEVARLISASLDLKKLSDF